MKPASLDGFELASHRCGLCGWHCSPLSCGGGSDRDGRRQCPGLGRRRRRQVARQLVRRRPAKAADGGRGGAGGRRLSRTPKAAQGLFGFGRRIRQVVVFGDSLSDVGTYQGRRHRRGRRRQVHHQPGIGSGPRSIGILFGARVTPFRQGFGGVSQVVGGSGFAMGGARVSQQPGIGCDPDADDGSLHGQALTIPVTQQISDYLERQRRSLQSPPDGVRVRRGERRLLPARAPSRRG